MIVAVNKMLKDVRVAIDMNNSSKPLVLDGDTDTLQLDDIIRSTLVPAIMQVEMEAPSRLLEYGHDFVEDRTIEWGEGGRGSIFLPDDFMRLVTFRMSDWRRAVFSAISDSDSEYVKLSSRYRGICGTPERPVVAIVNRGEGLVLEFYTCDSTDATVTDSVYVPIPEIKDDGIDVSEKCYKSAVYRAAFLTMASVGDQNANTMLEISKSLLI